MSIHSLKERAESENERLRVEVNNFAVMMEKKLRENDYKGGWKHMDNARLLEMLRAEIEELDNAVFLNEDEDEEDEIDSILVIMCEAADVANFAMMIFDNARTARKELEAKR